MYIPWVHSFACGRHRYVFALAYCEWCYNEHWCASLCLKYIFNSFGPIPRAKLLDHMVILCLTFEKLPNNNRFIANDNSHLHDTLWVPSAGCSIIVSEQACETSIVINVTSLQVKNIRLRGDLIIVAQHTNGDFGLKIKSCVTMSFHSRLWGVAWSPPTLPLCSIPSTRVTVVTMTMNTSRLVFSSCEWLVLRVAWVSCWWTEGTATEGGLRGPHGALWFRHKERWHFYVGGDLHLLPYLK